MSQSGNSIVIKSAWMQLGPPSQKNTAAFMIVENHSSKDVTLLSASSEVCKVVELHKMENVNEVMRMQKVDKVVIPAKGQMEFKPGGYHLMVIGLNRPLKEGEEVEVKLQFTDAIQKTVRVPVKNRESMQ
jgi:copper(I)-binding protein